MANLNRVLVMGNLGQDPELRHTPSGQAVTTLSVATSSSFKDKEGEPQVSTEWHRVVVWGKQAELCATYLKKGRAVFVEGRLQTRSWDDQAGVKHHSTEIVARDVRFVGPAERASHASHVDEDLPQVPA